MRRLVFGSLFIVSAYLLALSDLDIRAAEPATDSIPAKITREKKLKAKISVDSSEGTGLMLREILEEIKTSVRDTKVDGVKLGTLRITPDPKAGITLTTRIKFKATNEPVEVILDKMFEASGRPWGYYVNVATTKGDQEDGAIVIVADPTCRGYKPGDPRNKKADSPAKKEEPKKDKK